MNSKNTVTLVNIEGRIHAPSRFQIKSLILVSVLKSASAIHMFCMCPKRWVGEEASPGRVHVEMPPMYMMRAYAGIIRRSEVALIVWRPDGL